MGLYSLDIMPRSHFLPPEASTDLCMRSHAALWVPPGPQTINMNISWGVESRLWLSTRPTAMTSGICSLLAQGGPRFPNQERSLERRVEQVHNSFERFIYPPVNRLCNLALLDPYLYTQEAPA